MSGSLTLVIRSVVLLAAVLPWSIVVAQLTLSLHGVRWSLRPLWICAVYLMHCCRPAQCLRWLMEWVSAFDWVIRMIGDEWSAR